METSERRALEARGRCETCGHLEACHESQGYEVGDDVVCLVEGCGCHDRLTAEDYAAEETRQRIAHKRYELDRLRRWKAAGMPFQRACRTGFDTPTVSFAEEQAEQKREKLKELAELEADPELTESPPAP